MILPVKPDCNSAFAGALSCKGGRWGGVNECTWTEVKLRASPGPHDEVCRRCAIRFHRWVALSQWRETEDTVMQEPKRFNNVGFYFMCKRWSRAETFL